MIRNADDTYFQAGLGLGAAVRPDLDRAFGGGPEDRLRDGRVRTAGRITVRLAAEFGFCYGVDRAVRYAYEARRAFPDRRIFLAGPLIHNPQVHERLRALEIRILADDPPVIRNPGLVARDSSPIGVRPSDVVIVPAFGLPAAVLERLRATGCVLVDATCGSVLLVWKSVERLARDGFTAVVHGDSRHEETRATLSRVDAAGGRWVVVRHLNEARLLAEWLGQARMPNVEGRMNDRTASSDSTLDIRTLTFDLAASPGFHPGRDLECVGLAHQTTMLASESRAIAALLREAAAARWGAATLPERFRDFDTVCTATQDRQDAVEALVEAGVDLVLAIGGRDSHNTAHLAETAARRAPSYHIEGAEDLLDADAIRHWTRHKSLVSGLSSRVDQTALPPTRDKRLQTTDSRPEPPNDRKPSLSAGWLPIGRVTVGISAGASTPDAVTAAVVERLLEFGLATIHQQNRVSA